MDLYERNYINMRRLAPVMPPARVWCVSRTPSGLDLHLGILERCRYTSELILTYQFGQDHGAMIAEPNLRIRVYHDARQAEVMAADLRHSPPLPPISSPATRRKFPSFISAGGSTAFSINGSITAFVKAIVFQAFPIIRSEANSGNSGKFLGHLPSIS